MGDHHPPGGSEDPSACGDRVGGGVGCTSGGGHKATEGKHPNPNPNLNLNPYPNPNLNPNPNPKADIDNEMEKKRVCDKALLILGDPCA